MQIRQQEMVARSFSIYLSSAPHVLLHANFHHATFIDICAHVEANTGRAKISQEIVTLTKEFYNIANLSYL